MDRTGARRGRIAPRGGSGKHRPAGVRRWRLVAWTLAAVLTAAATAGAAEPDWSRQALARAGGDRHYWLLRPRSGPAPTVVLLQGALQDPRGFAEATGLPALAARGGIALAVPETVDGHWNDGRSTVYFGSPSRADDLGFLQALLDGLVTEGVASADALYLAGFSNGGLMALTLACRAGTVRPSGLVVAAATLGAAPAQACRPPVPLAFVLANGTADNLFPYAGGAGMVNGRTGEPMLGASATAAFFAGSNGCGTPRRLAQSAEPMGRGSAVEVTGYAGCPTGGAVVQVTVVGGGHQWPPGQVRALGAAAGTEGPASLAELAWQVLAGAARR